MQFMDDIYEKKFLRRSRSNCFDLSNVADIGPVTKSEIQEKLNFPFIDKRGHHFFSKKFLRNKEMHFS